MTIRALIAAGPNVAALLDAALGRYGFACTCVSDGVAVLDAFGRERFDVVVLDTWLAKKSGPAVASELRASATGRNVGICMLNADPAAKSEDALRRGLADAWFEIPFSPADVRKKLAELAHRATGAVADAMPIATMPGRRSLAATRASEPATTSTAARLLAGATAQPLGPRGASELMLELCRSQATGVLVMKHRLAEARIAVARGVIVGATDNGHDNRLGPRLLRRGKVKNEDVPRIQQWMQAHKGRVGDAVLGLGLLDATALLEELRLQAHERLLQATVWSEGDARFVRDDAEVLALAVDAFDVFDIVLAAFIRQPDEDAVARFVAAHVEEALSSTVDFEEGLMAYARLEPRSPLPLVLMSSSTLGKVLATLTTFPAPAAGTYAAHTRALWHAGLIRFASEPPRDGRPVPRPWRPEQSQELVDPAVVDAVQRVWLRVQGNDLYAALGVPRTASSAQIEKALSNLEATAGRARLEGKRLGPAEVIARELADFFIEARTVLLDPSARSAYDAAQAGALASSDDQLAAEELFLQGKLALQQEALEPAIDALRRATKLVHDDAELRAWLGWAEFLDAAERLANAVALVKRAAYDNPNAARPLVFLARIAAQRGDRAEALRMLREAQRRCPDDPDVVRELDEHARA